MTLADIVVIVHDVDVDDVVTLGEVSQLEEHL